MKSISLQMQFAEVSVGGTQAPNKTSLKVVNENIGFSYGDVLDGITIGKKHVGGKGGNQANLTLQEGEYWAGFKATSNPDYYGGVVTAIEFTTNTGRSVSANLSEIPATGNPPVSAVVENALIYSIELVSGDFINQITVFYIENF